MTHPVAVPLWLLLVLLAAGAWLLAERVLVPSVRWLFRRKVNQAIEQMNRRLRLELPPFKLNRRQVLIDRLTYDPQVLEVAQAWAAQQGVPPAVAIERVRRYATEICPSFNAYMYFRIGSALARALVRMLYRVRVAYADKQAFLGIAPRSSLVFVINHRSNMDYVLASYMVVRHAALSYAVGEWARVWPVQQLIRSMGAYFVRRNSGDELYRKVLARYVQMAIEGGIVQAVFPEGGLSRDGHLRPPKLGLIDYMVRNFDAQAERDVVFIPVGVNYDRVLEDRSLLLSADDSVTAPGALTATRNTLAFIGRNLALRLRNEWRRFGHAAVQFGRPLSLRDYCAQGGVDFRAGDAAQRHAKVAVLAEQLMAEVAANIPVLSVPLIALTLLAAPTRRYTALELKAALQERLDSLRRDGNRYLMHDAASSQAIDNGLAMMEVRRLVLVEDGLYRLNGAEQALVAYYARSITHLFAGSTTPSPPVAWQNQAP
ncbi:MAG: 1-acyl-sn-glycerol-3-phosphate acyltransferase [Proteobacteria bacterium]|jgi:glycerol-3-phosphate O-acyltransferase|nr:1-acyl-sn-glycerol-3-phosphate acyltransferase [Pseudomonadota bacterium]